MKNFQFFVNASDINDDTITLTGDLYHKIKNVLRYNAGDELILIASREAAGHSKKYLGSIESVSDKSVRVKIIDELDIKDADLFVTLYLALIKSKNFETAIIKATELGVDKIVPIQTKRSVVKIKKSDEPKKKRRWAALVKEAAAQCKRGDVPEITDIVSITDLGRLDDGAQLKIVCDENCSIDLRDHISDAKVPKSISAAVGPEGGFTKDEVRILNGLGFESVRLSGNILRSETVPVYLMSVFQYEFCE